jgi:hypothetical protein
MNKKNYLKELNEIKSIVNKIKKININENVRFEDDEDFNDLYAGEEEQPIEEPVQEPEVPAEEPVQEPEQCAGGECNLDKKSTEEIGMEELDKMGEVDQIRKITLNGMTKLADHPEDPQFQALLKIFQICNKSVDTKEDGGEK